MATKHARHYYSESKKAEMDIESMPTPHIMNALRKVVAAFPEHDKALADCLAQELRSRGCTLDVESGRWTLPPKPEEA